MSNALTTLTRTLATKLDMGDGANLIETLKATAFKGQVSDAQMTALLVVANQYALNPWTKEIYAFPDKNNGIVPVVGVDGWSRIINSHPQFDGIEFEQNDESCTCIIYRKDRNRPIKVTEWMAECRRSGMGPWQSHPRRMLRHKAMIQCARLAFGYGGIYDQDEAERIVEAKGSMSVIDGATGEVLQPRTAALPPYPADKFDANLPAWRDVIETGRKTADQLIAFIESRNTMTEQQKATLRAPAEPMPEAPRHSAADVAKRLAAAVTMDQLDEAAVLIASLPGLQDQAALNAKYDECRAEILSKE